MSDYNKYIEQLDELRSDENAEAIDAAQDALSFAQSIWKSLEDVGRVQGDMNLRAMELSLDVMNNQLSAAVLFMAGLPADIPGALRSYADAYEKHAVDDEVGKTVADSYRRLADTVEGLKTLAKAKQDLMINTIVDDEEDNDV